VEALTRPSLANIRALSRIPTTLPCRQRNHPCAHRVRPFIYFARGLSIRTAELLCRLIDSLSERCEVRYPTWYGFNFVPIISARSAGETGRWRWRRMNIRDIAKRSFLPRDSLGLDTAEHTSNSCVNRSKLHSFSLTLPPFLLVQPGPVSLLSLSRVFSSILIRKKWV